MKVIVKGDIYPSIESLDELGIGHEETADGVVVSFSRTSRVGQSGIKYENSSYISEYCPLLSEYIETGDESLSSFIYEAGGLGMITASGKIEKVETTEGEEQFVCSSALRLFERNRFSTIGFTTQSENAIENLVDYAEAMLDNSLPASKTLS